MTRQQFLKHSFNKQCHLNNVEITFHESRYTLLVLERLGFLDKVDFVLEDNDILQFHNLDGGKMLGCLWLRASFVSGNEEKSSVHDGGTV